MNLLCRAVLLVLLAGCGAAPRVVRLDTGQGTSLVHSPRGGQQQVKLGQVEFKEALSTVVRDVRPVSNPLQEARRLMLDASWQEEVYLNWTGRRLVLEPRQVEASHPTWASDELTRGYTRWCESSRRPGDCLSLLKGGPLLSADGRYTLAMSLALDSVWNETMTAFKDLAEPLAVQATLVSAMAVYMTLWVLPEPVSKGLAASLTIGLIAWLGVDTVWSLFQGWRRLAEEVDHATSFQQLREAGERFGKVMGRNAARIFILLATAAIGNTAGLAVKGPGLPGYTHAAVLAETQGGLRLAAMVEVQAVSLTAEGFTLALAPGAVAMTARGAAAGDSRGSDAASHEGSSAGGLKDVYTGVKNTPDYPSNFRSVQNGTTRHPVTNKALMEKLREIEPGSWKKVYKDGWMGSDKVSLHYFESPSGRVFNFKVKPGWSNQ